MVAGSWVPPNCWRTIWLSASELSVPHWLQTKRTGLLKFSAPTSRAYFTPHWHWILMVIRHGLGFSRTTPFVSVNGNVAFALLISRRPSTKRKLPPYL